MLDRTAFKSPPKSLTFSGLKGHNHKEPDGWEAAISALGSIGVLFGKIDGPGS